MSHSKNIKNPPKGGNNDSWNFKPCRYKKTIIKKGNWKILPNGDLVIMARESEIGFKSRKKTGGGNRPTNRELLLELREDFKNLKNDFNNLKDDFNTVVKLNNLKTK